MFLEESLWQIFLGNEKIVYLAALALVALLLDLGMGTPPADSAPAAASSSKTRDLRWTFSVPLGIMFGTSASEYSMELKVALSLLLAS